VRASTDKTLMPLTSDMALDEEALPRDVSCRTAPSRSSGLFPLYTPHLLAGLSPDGTDKLISARVRINRGDSLYRAGDGFRSLYALHTGFLKSCVVLENGRELITGFHMAGEMMGMDGISTEHHVLDAIALENSDVYVIPFAAFEKAASMSSLLQREFHRMMSREMECSQGVMMLLGTMRAEERVALFLLNLSMRFAARGYSPLEFNLRMTRNEIGSHLGLKLETVSRTFSRLQDNHLLAVEKRHIRILDIDSLRSVVHQAL